MTTHAKTLEALRKARDHVSLLLACLLFAGCDASRDEPLTTTDVGVLAASCATNGGMKRAQRVRPFWTSREWRIDCADGARFVLPAP